MTVKELQKLLSEYPEDMEVAIMLDYDKWRDIRKVCYAKRYIEGFVNYKEVTIATQGIVGIQ